MLPCTFSPIKSRLVSPNCLLPNSGDPNSYLSRLFLADGQIVLLYCLFVSINSEDFIALFPGNKIFSMIRDSLSINQGILHSSISTGVNSCFLYHHHHHHHARLLLTKKGGEIICQSLFIHLLYSIYFGSWIAT